MNNKIRAYISHRTDIMSTAQQQAHNEITKIRSSMEYQRLRATGSDAQRFGILNKKIAFHQAILESGPALVQPAPVIPYTSVVPVVPVTKTRVVQAVVPPIRKVSKPNVIGKVYPKAVVPVNQPAPPKVAPIPVPVVPRKVSSPNSIANIPAPAPAPAPMKKRAPPSSPKVLVAPKTKGRPKASAPQSVPKTPAKKPVVAREILSESSFFEVEDLDNIPDTKSSDVEDVEDLENLDDIELTDGDRRTNARLEAELDELEDDLE
jgi:hypothetical protein